MSDFPKVVHLLVRVMNFFLPTDHSISIDVSVKLGINLSGLPNPVATIEQTLMSEQYALCRFSFAPA